MENKYDLIIIGGGATAFATAIRANELKTKTAIVNAGLPLGGTCVNVGCVPSKKLLWAGEVMHLAKNHNVSGLDIEVKDFDFQKVVAEELKLVSMLRTEKYEKVLKNLPLVTVIDGKAKFTSKNEIEVNGEKLTASKFVIATGSTANVPPIEGIQEVGFITHIEALTLKQQPKELTIIGAGAVGIEFAQMYARFGTKVTVLQRGNAIVPHVEKELTDRLVEILTNEGVNIITNAKVSKAHLENDKKVVLFSVAGKEQKISSDEILLAAGKIPNTHDLGLENVGVEINDRQAIVVNEFFQTSQEYIFAGGDVANLPSRLETTAGREGTLIAENILEGKENSIEYDTVPLTIFTDPQVASVGLTEDNQIEKIGVCACRTVSFEHVPKAIIMNRTEGLIKMVIHPETKQIMGVHILAPNAGELIAEAMMLVKNKNTIDDVVNSLPMFPTLSEAIKIAALSFTKDISKLSCCV
jgi:mercuric reductase